jgi:hypothetical protein
MLNSFPTKFQFYFLTDINNEKSINIWEYNYADKGVVELKEVDFLGGNQKLYCKVINIKMLGTIYPRLSDYFLKNSVSDFNKLTDMKPTMFYGFNDFEPDLASGLMVKENNDNYFFYGFQGISQSVKGVFIIKINKKDFNSETKVIDFDKISNNNFLKDKKSKEYIVDAIDYNPEKQIFAVAKKLKQGLSTDMDAEFYSVTEENIQKCSDEVNNFLFSVYPEYEKVNGKSIFQNKNNLFQYFKTNDEIIFLVTPASKFVNVLSPSGEVEIYRIPKAVE